MSIIIQFHQPKSKQTMPLSAKHETFNKHEMNNRLISLLAKCQLDDKQAFNQLYQYTSARLNGIAYRITRNVDSANEVLQEAFIQIWQNRKAYQVDKSEPFTWLASIVRYRAYDRLRYDKRRHQQDMIEYNDSEINLADISAQSTSLDLGDYSAHTLHHCLSKLAQKQSQSILMAYLYGYSREEISAHFDTPLNTIKSWIRRGLGRLQLCLKG